MKPGDDLNRRASELLEDARKLQSAAARPGCLIGVPETLVSLEEALQVLSAAWYQVAAEALPGRDGLSREQEVRLMGALHDVGAGFARCARQCREGRSTVTATIARQAATGRADDRRRGNEFPRFQRYDRPGQRVA